MRFLMTAAVLAVGGAAYGQSIPAFESADCPGGRCPRPVVQAVGGAVQDVRQVVGQAIQTVGQVVQGPVYQPSLQPVYRPAVVWQQRPVGPVRRAIRALVGR